MYTLVLHHNLNKLMLDSSLHAALSVALAAYMPRVSYTFSCHQWPDLQSVDAGNSVHKLVFCLLGLGSRVYLFRACLEKH